MNLIKRTLQLLVIFLTMSLYQNCAPARHELLGDSLSSSSSALTGGSTYVSNSADEVAALNILSVSCAGCHGASSGSGNIFGLHDVNHMVTAGYIVPGNATSSLFIDSITSGRMPPGGGMSSTDVNSLITWINGMTLQQTTGGNGSGSGGNTPPPPPPTLEATFSSISKLILQPKCVTCHGPSVAKSSIRYDSYDLTLRTVRVGLASESALYKECQNGSMPPTQNGYQPLNSDELRAIADWINAGASNN